MVSSSPLPTLAVAYGDLPPLHELHLRLAELVDGFSGRVRVFRAWDTDRARPITLFQNGPKRFRFKDDDEDVVMADGSTPPRLLYSAPDYSHYEVEALNLLYGISASNPPWISAHWQAEDWSHWDSPREPGITFCFYHPFYEQRVSGLGHTLIESLCWAAVQVPAAERLGRTDFRARVLGREVLADRSAALPRLIADLFHERERGLADAEVAEVLHHARAAAAAAPDAGAVFIARCEDGLLVTIPVAFDARALSAADSIAISVALRPALAPLRHAGVPVPEVVPVALAGWFSRGRGGRCRRRPDRGLSARLPQRHRPLLPVLRARQISRGSGAGPRHGGVESGRLPPGGCARRQPALARSGRVSSPVAP